MGRIPAMLRPTPEDLQEAFHELLWNDPRRRDDRTEFTECVACGAAVRWVANLGSRFGSSLQIVARPVATARGFDPVRHMGHVAVFRDRTGFTVSRATERDDLDDALLYRCHWDVCEHAARLRDELHRQRHGSAGAGGPGATDTDALHRYAAWVRDRASS